jgi:hypothetical protein
MGFSTIYLRSFKLDRPLTQDHAVVLMEFHDTEHGIDEDEDEPAGLYKPETYYCQWIPTEDWTGIEWDGIEKFYHSQEWLVYLIERFFKPWGYTLNGESPWYIDDFEEAGILKVVDNVVSEEAADIALIKKKYGEIDLYQGI